MWNLGWRPASNNWQSESFQTKKLRLSHLNEKKGKKSVTYLLMNAKALDHKNNAAIPTIKLWATKVSKWHSRNSKRNHITVAPPRIPPDNFLSLHRKTSATVTKDSFFIRQPKIKRAKLAI